ncbi:hypothetical protein Catovirus_2_169 [Catovirus CTV1]|uniref:Nuclease associated modular domain-containing protein n=1 Tax=Catovirus CTV1 TaxID=1977631 RepID=A0A1V0SBW8_9VIRU|nr:hypothetical protein Catovirus_2_169 [Catovirus CTV1]
MFGKTHTQEVKLKISTVLKGNINSKNKKKNYSEKTKEKLSELRKTKTGDKNPFYGKKHNEETKKKMSVIKKGIIPVNRKIVIANEKEYESITKLAKSENISPALVIYRIKKGVYKYKNEEGVTTINGASDKDGDIV